MGSNPIVSAQYLASDSLPLVLRSLASALPFKSENVLVAFHSDLGHHRSVAMAELFAQVCVEAGLSAQIAHLCGNTWGESQHSCGGCINCKPDASRHLHHQNCQEFLRQLDSERRWV